MRPNYKVPPIITALAIAVGLFASAVTSEEATRQDRAACAKDIVTEANSLQG